MAQTDVRLPPVFKATHQTAGLPNFPAIDVFGNAGESVQAPVAGTIVDVHGIPWNATERVGGETAYLQGDNGKTYFLTHLQGNVPSGRVQAGEVIGQVAQVPHNWWPSHIHEGVHQGIYQPGGSSAPVTQTLAAAPTPSASTSGQQLLLQLLSKRPGLDPQAVLAVSRQEGYGGGIGDNGTSFGPFQLHYGGAYPAWAPQGQQASQQWAWSRPGINYALNQIAGVAKGLRGQPAITNIVQRFERPLNPQAEIQGAVSAYKPGPLPTAPTAASASPLAPKPAPRVTPAAAAAPLKPAAPKVLPQVVVNVLKSLAPA